MESHNMAAKDCIKNVRYRLGLSQREFAALVGVPPATLSLYETGYRHPGFKNIRKIVDALRKEGISMEYIDLKD